jgi:hypothetical protein
MSNKKQPTVQYLAVLHFLTAGFVVPWIFLKILPYFYATSGIEPGANSFNYTGLLFAMVSIWLGVKISALYIDKLYVIRDRASTIRLSTMIVAVIYGGGLFVTLVMLRRAGAEGVLFLYPLIEFITRLILYKMASERYLPMRIVEKLADGTVVVDAEFEELPTGEESKDAPSDV